MPYIEVGKENSGTIKIHYEDHGSGQPVVLIHGFPLDGNAWEKQKLALLTANYRTITYDRRGFGKSSKPAFGYDYDTFVADLDKLLTSLDLKDVILVGHSMGTGEVAHYLGTIGSERISKAVFVSPIPPFLLKTDDNPEGVDKSVFDGIQQTIKADRLAYLSQFLADFYNTDENLGKRVSEEVVRYSWNTASVASPRGTYECVTAWLTDFRGDLPNIDVPTLIIHGKSDRVLPFEITGNRLQTELKDSKFVALENAPHGIPWTHAEEINKEILAFAQQ
ncbi:MAG: alpha/beta hydrolase [Candidatus Saccharibacteria bacterium]|nr:alpha/beta hydrolase [Candidatus Saccharibacteria bacterium]